MSPELAGSLHVSFKSPIKIVFFVKGTTLTMFFEKYRVVDFKRSNFKRPESLKKAEVAYQMLVTGWNIYGYRGVKNLLFLKTDHISGFSR